MRLTEPLGVDLGDEGDTDLTVLNLVPGGQLDLLGEVKAGDRLMEAGGTRLETTDHFVSIMAKHKSQGASLLKLTFGQVRVPCNSF